MSEYTIVPAAAGFYFHTVRKICGMYRTDRYPVIAWEISGEERDPILYTGNDERLKKEAYISAMEFPSGYVRTDSDEQFESVNEFFLQYSIFTPEELEEIKAAESA